MHVVADAALAGDGEAVEPAALEGECAAALAVDGRKRVVDGAQQRPLGGRVEGRVARPEEEHRVAPIAGDELPIADGEGLLAGGAQAVEEVGEGQQRVGADGARHERRCGPREAAAGLARGGGEPFVGEARRELPLGVFGEEVGAAREEGSVDLFAGGLVEAGLQPAHLGVGAQSGGEGAPPGDGGVTVGRTHREDHRARELGPGERAGEVGVLGISVGGEEVGDVAADPEVRGGEERHRGHQRGAQRQDRARAHRASTRKSRASSSGV